MTDVVDENPASPLEAIAEMKNEKRIGIKPCNRTAVEER